MLTEEILEWLMKHGRDWVSAVNLIKWYRARGASGANGIVKAFRHIEELHTDGWLEATRHLPSAPSYRLSDKAINELKERGNGISY